MVRTRLLQPIAPADLVSITRLHDDAEARDGHPSLNEAVWRDLDRPLQHSAGVLATVPDHDDPVGYVHVYRSDSFATPHWGAGMVMHPRHRHSDVEAALLGRALEYVAGAGGGDLVLWMLDPDDDADRAASDAGFRHQRDLLQQRVPLPIAEEPKWPTGVSVRAFVPGEDDAAWVTVNNRAFDHHPEQGGWTEATLQRRMAEAWFDPKGFLLAVDRRGVAGYCWTKVHPPSPGGDPELGEIFVIGVDPSRRGLGLGRALVVAGLASLAARGVRTGMLFVDGANEPALELYKSLGFSTHRLDRAYELRVTPV